jgi:hypothetical protein
MPLFSARAVASLASAAPTITVLYCTGRTWANARVVWLKVCEGPSFGCTMSHSTTGKKRVQFDGTAPADGFNTSKVALTPSVNRLAPAYRVPEERSSQALCVAPPSTISRPNFEGKFASGGGYPISISKFTFLVRINETSSPPRVDILRRVSIVILPVSNGLLARPDSAAFDFAPSTAAPRKQPGCPRDRTSVLRYTGEALPNSVSRATQSASAPRPPSPHHIPTVRGRRSAAQFRSTGYSEHLSSQLPLPSTPHDQAHVGGAGGQSCRLVEPLPRYIPIFPKDPLPGFPDSPV